MLHFKNRLMLLIGVVRWLSHRATAFILFYYTFKPQPGVQLTFWLPLQTHMRFSKTRYFLYSPAVWQGDIWFHNDMKCSQLLVNHGETTLFFFFFWIPFKAGLRFWVMGEWGLVAITELPIRAEFFHLPSIPKPSLAEDKHQRKKGYLLNFWHLIPEQISLMTIVYIYALSISASIFKQRVHGFPCGRGFWSLEISTCRFLLGTQILSSFRGISQDYRNVNNPWAQQIKEIPLPTMQLLETQSPTGRKLGFSCQKVNHSCITFVFSKSLFHIQWWLTCIHACKWDFMRVVSS